MKRNLLKDSLVFPLLMQGTSALNFLFQLFLARKLSKFDYGLINSLFSMYVLIATPALTLQNTLSRYTAELSLKKQHSYIHALFWKSMKYISIVSLFLFILVILFSPILSDYLHSPQMAYMSLMGFSIALSLILPVAIGILLGSQKFFQVGLITLIENIIKTVLGVLAIVLGYHIGGILMGVAISMLFALLCFIYFIKPFQLTQQSSNTPFPIVKKDIISYSIKSGFTLFALSFLTFFDVIAVQHFFGQPGSQVSGTFAITSMIAKIILFATQPFIPVMLPKVTSEYCQNQKPTYLLTWYLLLTAGAGMCITLFYYFFPEFIIRLFTQTEIAQIQNLLILYATSILFLSMLYVTVNYCLAKDQFFILPLLLLGAAAEILLFTFFHSHIEHIIMISLYVNTSLMFFSLFFIFLLEKRGIFQQSETPSLMAVKDL